AERLQASERALVARWLEELVAFLSPDPSSVFPGDDLLDHMPALVREIAEYLRPPAEREIAVNSSVMDKARELGKMRHEQQASVHQLLREYALLERILSSFIAAETAKLEAQPSPQDCFEVSRRLRLAVIGVMQTTVDTFVSLYTQTIQQQTNRLAQFNRLVTHELRNPIGAMKSAGDLLSKDVYANDQRFREELIGVIRRKADLSLGIIGSLERLARAETTVDAPSTQLVDSTLIANDVAEQLRDFAATREVEIRVEPNLPTVVTDIACLEMILMNLVSNGIKYADINKRERFVEIGTSSDGSTQDAVSIVVRDNGIGIPGEAKEKVFERFFRAHQDHDRRLGNDGSGLGLAIVRECVDAISG
ncbi:MAG: sensor histidine kinase, partial [Acidimicrobiia bacterium]